MSEFTAQKMAASFSDFAGRYDVKGASKWEMARPVFLCVCREQWKTIRQFGGVRLDEAVAIMTMNDRQFDRWVWA